MAKLTVKKLESITADQHGIILRDDGNLLGKVGKRKSGFTISFYYRYKWNRKTRDLSCGTWPKNTLSEIRGIRDRAKLLLSEGLDPGEAKKAARIEVQNAVATTIAEAAQSSAEMLTISDLFDKWITDGVNREDNNRELQRRFGKDVIPFIGKTPIKSLTEDDLLRVLRILKERGVNRSVVVLKNDLAQMLRWAEKRQPWRKLMVNGNPADLVNVVQLLDPDYTEERSRVLSSEEISELYSTFANLEKNYNDLPAGEKYAGIRPLNERVQCAVWICLGTLCRIGELLKSQWKHVDFEKRIWFIPFVDTKGVRIKRQDHYVFLSDFALDQFKRLHVETGHTKYLFPNTKGDSHVDTKTVSKLIGDRQIRFKNRSKPFAGRHNDDSLVLAGGANGDWTTHDLRRTGSTIMQSYGITPDIIDRCQNHLIWGASKVRRHYLLYEYAEEKTRAWQLLGEHIQSIIDGKAKDQFKKIAN